MSDGPVVTQIRGYLYTARGTVVTAGQLRIRLPSAMASLDGFTVAPFSDAYDLSPDNGGLIDLALVPTQGATPAGLRYHVEFDPNPADRRRPLQAKPGYWHTTWAVPDTRVAGEPVVLPLGQLSWVG